MAWFVWPPSPDPDDYRERGRWEREHPIARGDREPGAAPSDADDEEADDGPDPDLRTRPKILVYLGTIAVWLPVVTALHLHWWTFERGLFASVFAPFLLAGGVERVVLRLRPDLDRHHDPDALVRGRRAAAQLGDRARPYWARDGRDGAAGEGPEPGTADRPGDRSVDDADPDV
jgi:hypothetical protein